MNDDGKTIYNRCTLPEGVVEVHMPRELCADSVLDLADWFELIMRRYRRAAATGDDWREAIGCAPATEGSMSPEDAVAKMRGR